MGMSWRPNPINRPGSDAQADEPNAEGERPDQRQARRHEDHASLPTGGVDVSAGPLGHAFPRKRERLWEGRLR